MLFHPGIQASLYYIKPSTRRVINIVVTSFPVAIAPIFMFHSTAVMNYFTSNAIVSAYPRMTADLGGLVNSCAFREDDKTAGWFRKYKGRGVRTWLTADEWVPDHWCRECGYCGNSSQSVDDQWMMRVCFSSNRNEAASVVDAG